MMRVYQIVIDTYEPGTRYPIVSHTFRGPDKATAEKYEAAHRQSDAFFRECGATGLYAGKVRCSNVRRAAGWVEI